MTTTEKLEVIKDVMGTAFLLATEQSLAQGLQFKYKSYPIETPDQKGWIVDIIVREAGYGERNIQQFSYQRPKGIDAKKMEYEVLVNVLSSMIQTSILTWYQTAIYLTQDKDLQKAIKNGEEDNFVTNE